MNPLESSNATIDSTPGGAGRFAIEGVKDDSVWRGAAVGKSLGVQVTSCQAVRYYFNT